MITIQDRDKHVYFSVGEMHDTNSSEYKTAENNLIVAAFLICGLCLTEFLIMLLGSSVPPNFAVYNLLQVLCHLLGSLFVLWFKLDSWRYVYIWWIFALFVLPSFLLEIFMLQQAIKFNRDINSN